MTFLYLLQHTDKLKINLHAILVVGLNKKCRVKNNQLKYEYIDDSNKLQYKLKIASFIKRSQMFWL